MDEQPLSYWIMVLVVGPLAGVVAGVFWTAWMAAWMGRSFVQVLVPGGFFFGLTMTVTFTAMYAVMFWGVRRELPVNDPRLTRAALEEAAGKVRYRLVEEVDDYLKFAPKWGLYKPACAYVQAWFVDGQLILLGPQGAVKRIVKRVRQDSV
jgi:hypothetical protein